MAEPLNRDITQPTIGLWNRIEARPTKHDFSQALSAETYDALWMLNRQWQFGEFKGEDTGSAVFSQIRMNNKKLNRFSVGNDNFQASNVELYDKNVPLEAKVEAEKIAFDLKTHLQISAYWKRLLQQTFGANTSLYSNLLSAFKQTYTLAAPTFSNIEEEANHIIHKRAALLRQKAAQKWLLDGEQLYTDFKQQQNNNQAIASLLSAVTITTTESNQLNQIAQDFVQWFQDLWVQPQGDEAWSGNRLEYQFANTVHKGLSVLPQQKLVADEYYHGHLDWYAYDIDNLTGNSVLNTGVLPNENFTSTVFTRTMLPTAVRFQGMPVPRWWQFEEGSINFGNISQNTTDIAHILLAQFGLIYSNDWQILPFKVPVGSVSEIEKLMVTDVFGQKTIVRSANLPSNLSSGNSSAWDYWAMFNLSHRENANSLVPDGRLLLPPTVHKVMEGSPIEKVIFARDEVSNVVWAIEQTIQGPLGNGVDWDNLSKERKKIILDQLAAGQTPSPLEAANYSYQYITDNTPENWIPFVARNLVPENIMILQRGVIQRHYPGIPAAIQNIRPAGKMLNENTNGNAYFLFNEEIPKAGIEVSRSFQRARWFNGKVVNWLGRRKTAAFGQLHNQLKFDTTKNFNKLDIE